MPHLNYQITSPLTLTYTQFINIFLIFNIFWNKESPKLYIFSEYMCVFRHDTWWTFPFKLEVLIYQYLISHVDYNAKHPMISGVIMPLKIIWFALVFYNKEIKTYFVNVGSTSQSCCCRSVTFCVMYVRIWQ